MHTIFEILSLDPISAYYFCPHLRGVDLAFRRDLTGVGGIIVKGGVAIIGPSARQVGR